MNDWEQRELKKSTKLITKGTTPRDKSGKGTINFIKVENIVNGKIHPGSYINIEEHNGYLKRSKLEENDLLFSIAGTLGRSALVDKSILPANTNQALAIIRGYEFDPYFLITSLSGKVVKDYIRKNPTVGAQPNLSLEQIGNLILSTPVIKEQEKIGLFFKQLDNLITLHQRKLINVQKLYFRLIKNRKNGLNIQFLEYFNDWEQRKLGDVANIVGGGTPSTNNSEYWNGNIDWYSPAEIGDQIFVKESQKRISELGLKKSSARILPPGTVLFTSRAGIGNTAILAKEGTTNQGFQSIVPIKNELDAYFIFSKTYELKHYGQVVGAGSTFIEVSGKQMAKMPISIPVFEEQQKIGSFFKQLDNLITLHQRKTISRV